ncbi:MAG: hypothetical protein M1834_009731 [Cirrosporium novae-zelandiae]|nr:MAG: hypothetical protein M1834_009731 [Cirrosporium novae-zelandiae]
MDPMQEGGDFEIPPLRNQPPQIFGGVDSDGSPLIPTSLPGPIFTDDQRPSQNEDGNDAKRRRIARACDMCRKKKIKCDGKMPKCSHCINYKTDCVFTQVEKKRNPPKGTKYIEGLENRLGRMESLLRLSGLITEDDAGKTDLGTLEKRLAGRALASARPSSKTSVRSSPIATVHDISNTNSPPQETTTLSVPQSNVASPDSQGRSEEEVEQLSDMMCSLVTNNCGETRYIGSSSGFSIFSPQGIQWVNEKTGDSSFQDMIAAQSQDDSKWIYWKPEIFGDLFQRRVYKSLPPKEEALSLLKDYFENFNCMFPLFHEPTFMHLVERQYSRDPFEGSGWWASLNVALAIAHRLRVMSNLVPKEEDEKAWSYLKNAMGVLTELTMRNSDLLSVQALLGLALFLQGTPNPQPSYFLVAAALRISHSIGLHKRGSGFNLNEVEIEQRKRVFWIAYILDKDLCIRSGRPPAQDDNDMNVELPAEDPADNIGNVPLSDGNGKVNFFRLMCQFATIASKVYNRLYSVKASQQTDGELLHTIGELDTELEEWKDSIPIDLRPGHEIKATHSPLNPQDPRAKTDVKLMNHVVNFLSTLNRDEANGGVRRMLSVCTEFERIAKLVLDKTDRESHLRRKRKSNPTSGGGGGKLEKDDPSGSRPPSAPSTSVPQISSPNSSTAPSNSFTENFSNGQQHINPHLHPRFHREGNIAIMQDINNVDFSNINVPMEGIQYMDMSSQPNAVSSGVMAESYQTPFFPPDLWSLPMSAEWDWGDMMAGNLPPDINGINVDQGQQQQQHQQPHQFAQ